MIDDPFNPTLMINPPHSNSMVLLTSSLLNLFFILRILPCWQQKCEKSTAILLIPPPAPLFIRLGVAAYYSTDVASSHHCGARSLCVLRHFCPTHSGWGVTPGRPLASFGVPYIGVHSMLLP